MRNFARGYFSTWENNELQQYYFILYKLEQYCVNRAGFETDKKWRKILSWEEIKADLGKIYAACYDRESKNI